MASSTLTEDLYHLRTLLIEMEDVVNGARWRHVLELSEKVRAGLTGAADTTAPEADPQVPIAHVPSIEERVNAAGVRDPLDSLVFTVDDLTVPMKEAEQALGFLEGLFAAVPEDKLELLAGLDFLGEAVFAVKQKLRHARKRIEALPSEVLQPVKMDIIEQLHRWRQRTAAEDVPPVKKDDSVVPSSSGNGGER